MKILNKRQKAMLLKFAGIAFCFCLLCAGRNVVAQVTWQAAVDAGAKLAPDARIVVLDAQTGRLLAAHNLNEAAKTLAEPGSTLKPLVLYQRIAEGRWSSATRVTCARNLQIEGHRLNCTHPQSTPFDAEEALTWSCNTYFANLAKTLGPGELEAMLRKSGLLSASGLAANEATAIFHAPATTEKTQLAMLGVAGVRVSPLEMAEAYRWLARELVENKNSEAAQVVAAGLADSASFGMARAVSFGMSGAASLGGVAIAGKTGTAVREVQSQTHGWFAGFAPFDAAIDLKPQIVVVVYLPVGRGTDAARVAAEVLKNSPLAKADATKQVGR
jgi:cell division protein FtsI/penicillin-binding protein 2